MPPPPTLLSVLCVCVYVCVSVCCATATATLTGSLGLAYYRAPQQHTCVDIPRNLSLCREIGYDKMRLPNLLEHDTVLEATQQAVSWVPLQNVHCDADTQLFLCSLFSPVCLDHPIYPCRSLCEKVRRGCEGRMRTYGFPWPEMFHCDKFPVDNDMCIASRTRTETPPPPGPATGSWADGRQQIQVFNRRLYPPKTPGSSGAAGNGCKMCNHVETYENILDNFCTSDFVIRTRFKRVHKSKLNCKKVKILKKLKPGILSRKLRRPVLILDPPNLCCEEKIKKKNQENYLVMGHIRGNNLVPSFIMQWIAKSSKIFKQAIRMFKNLNCTDPKFISRSVIGDMLHLGDLSAVSNPVFTQKDVQFPFSMSVPSN